MLSVGGNQIEIKHYPDGTLNIKNPLGGIVAPSEEPVVVSWKYENEEELIALCYLVWELRDCGFANISLFLPYVPNARMDRVKEVQDIFTLKHFSRIINSLNFRRVAVNDVHSNVSLALIDRVVEGKPKAIIEAVMGHVGLSAEKDILFYPDEGSAKRYGDMITFPHGFGMKNRDWVTGDIKGLDILGTVPSEPFNVLIVDDICSRGGTFLHSARALKKKGAEKIWLYVTHCENTILDGELINSGLLEGIFTTDSIYTASHELITIVR